MIISASYRTDIPAYYGEWFLNRLQAGFAEVRNPYGGKVYRVDLSPDAVDGFVFWTRNPKPFSTGFNAVQRLKLPFVLQMTISGYPRSLEPGVIDLAAAVQAFREIAAEFGPNVAVWRYDPVLLSAETPAQSHRDQVARIADALAGATNECVFSFAHIYRKSKRNLNAANVRWRDPGDAAKRRLLNELGAIVADRGMRPTVCAQPDLLSPGLAAAQCIDGARLASLGAPTARLAAKGARPGCMCVKSRDIGRYDACPQGCAYCYANQSRAAARRTRQNHASSDVAL